MKILIVNKYLYYKGGAETYALKIGKYLEQNGHEVQYFGMYSDKNIVGNKLQLYTEEMDFHTTKIKRLLYPFKIIYSLEAKRKISKIINKFKPDIIHLNNINFQITPSIIEVAYKRNIPIIQTVHDYQMICPNHLLYNDKICEKCIKGNKFNCVKGKCIHGSRIKSFIGAIESILYTKILKTYTKVHMFVCPSKFLEDKLLEASNIYVDKTKVIHNFIEQYNIAETSFKEDYILYFGRLSNEKGLDILLEAVKELPQVRVKIVGAGPLEDKCIGIKNVEYGGFKTGEELREIIKKAKFTIYPSVWYENCPLSILESESLGTPVITANYGGMKELVTDNETGILLNTITKDSLKNAILNLYNNENKIKKMSENCLLRRNEMITIEKYCEQIMNIYQDAIDNRRN